MSGSNTERFVQALQGAERTGDVGPLAALFSDDAELLSYTRDRRGRDAAGFWREYLAAFGRVRSNFTRVTDAGTSAILEWTSDGTLPDGHPVQYEGVSLLEFRGDKVARFRTYYDSAAFLPQGAKHAADAAAAVGTNTK